MSELIGQVLSKVEVQKLIGRGGMAEVYLGRHATLNRPVAVKVLQAHLSEDSTLLNRFTSEAQAIAAMRHPNIVQVFDFDVAADRPYMVMELLEGPSLKDLISTMHAFNQALPLKTVSRLVTALAAALDYAHARGIVHRDIKPANIMLRRASGKIDSAEPLPSDVEPILTDFGVAHIADSVSHTVSGTIIGTPAYMSPEQIRGDAVDARSDIYSLGVILYELIVGKVPFAGDTQASVLMKHVNEPIPVLPAEFVDDFQPVIDRALAKDPVQRFQKASDLALTFQAALGLPADPDVTEPFLRQIADQIAQDRGETATGRTGSLTRSDVGPTAGVTAVQSPAATRINPLWVVAGIGGLVLIVGLILLGIQLGRNDGLTVTQPAQTVATQPGSLETLAVTQPPVDAPPTGPVGIAIFNDDTLVVTLKNLPAPTDGSVYFAWLTDPDSQPLALGALEAQDGAASVKFSSPDGKKLVATHSSFAISEESAGSSPAAPGKIVFAGELDPAMVKQLRHLDKISKGATLKAAILNGLRTQNDFYNSHLNYATGAIITSDLPAAKSHAEHVININVGSESADYADWNGNGRLENPGDEVGLIPYLLMVKEAARSAAADPSAPADATRIADTVALAVDSLIPTLNNANRLAKQLVTADEIDASTTLLADELGGLQTTNAVALLRQEADKLNLVFAVEIVPVSQ